MPSLLRLELHLLDFLANFIYFLSSSAILASIKHYMRVEYCLN